MNGIFVFVLKVLRKLFRKNRNDPFSWLTDSYCQYKDQDANDYILNRLNRYQGGGLMLAKWGTIELNQVIATYMARQGYSINDYKEMIQGIVPIPENKPNLTEIISSADEQTLKELDKKQIQNLSQYYYERKEIST